MREMTIKRKLFASVAVLVLISLAMGVIAIRNVGKLGDSVQDLGRTYNRASYLAGQIGADTAELLSTSRAIMSRGYQKDPEKARTYNAQYAETLAKVKREAAEILEHTNNAQIRELVQMEILDKLDVEAQANTELYEYVMKLDTAGALVPYNERVLPLSKAVSQAGANLASLEGHLCSNKAEEDASLVGPARNLSILMIVLSLLVSVCVIKIVSDISNQLNDRIGELRDGAEQVANAASQVSSSSQSLAQGASEQAASLQETSASSEEINSMARKNTDNSRATADLLKQSQAKVTVANNHLAEMVVSMNNITDSSGKISNIIKVIDEIAFQTNILALNAAVEAARAGEAGMGFAVVADEVRSLAQRSAQAAKDTAILIEESIAKSSEGKRKVDEVAHAIRAINEDTAKVKVMVDEVSLGSEEQSRGIDQISKAVAQMEQVTQATAASAEECAASAEELNAQSEAMKDTVNRLHAMVDGDNGAAGDGGESLLSRRPASTRSASRIQPTRTYSPAQFRASTKRPSAVMGAKNTVPAMQELPLEDNFHPF